MQAAPRPATLPQQSSVDSKDVIAAVTPLEIDDTAMFQRKKAPAVSLEDSVTQMKRVSLNHNFQKNLEAAISMPKLPMRQGSGPSSYSCHKQDAWEILKPVSDQGSLPDVHFVLCGQCQSTPKTSQMFAP